MIDWWLWLLFGLMLGIFVDKYRTDIVFEVRYWFSNNWVYLAVGIPMAVAIGSEIGFVVSAFLNNGFMVNVCFVIMVCDLPIIFWFIWISHRKPKNPIVMELVQR